MDRDDLPDAPTEGGSDYDGAFSYAAEWHAFTHGVFMGFTSHPLQTPAEPDNADVKKESHYYRGGYIIGTLLLLMVMLALGGAGAKAMGLPLPA